MNDALDIEVEKSRLLAMARRESDGGSSRLSFLSGDIGHSDLRSVTTSLFFANAAVNCLQPLLVKATQVLCQLIPKHPVIHLDCKLTTLTKWFCFCALGFALMFNMRPVSSLSLEMMQVDPIHTCICPSKDTLHEFFALYGRERTFLLTDCMFNQIFH